MKRAKKLISMLLVCVMLLGMIAEFPVNVFADFTFSIVEVDNISLQIPVPLAKHKPDTGLIRVKKALTYDGSAVSTSLYEIKSLKWFEVGDSKVIEYFENDRDYVAEIRIRTKGEGFWGYPSNMPCYVNGVKASCESNNNNNELIIRATFSTVDNSAKTAIDNISVNGVENREDLPAYVNCSYSADIVFPKALKEAGYTILVDYTEYYYKKGESKAYTTYTRTYDSENLDYIITFDQSDSYYKLETDGIGDIPGREGNIVVDYFIVPPSGRGSKTLVQRHIHSVDFLYEDFHESMLISAASVGDQVKRTYEKDVTSDKITVDPYFQEPFVITWATPQNHRLNTVGGKNGTSDGDVQYKMRVFVDGKEIKNTETEIYATGYLNDVCYTRKMCKTYLNNVIGGVPGDEVKIRAEIYVRYLDGGADDGTVESDPIKTFDWTVKYSSEVENDHSSYIEAVYAEGSLIEKGEGGYKATVQAYIPQDIEFQFEWLSTEHFYDETIDHTIRAFVYQSPSLDSATDLHDPTLGENYVELEKDSDYYVGNNAYRYPIKVLGKHGDVGSVTLQLWFCDGTTGALIKKIDTRRIDLTFADRKDIFALDINEDGKVINQSHSYVKLDRWEGFDDAYYTLENQNGGYTYLTTDTLTPFDLTFIYKRPDCIVDAPADLRYRLEPMLYYSTDGNNWRPFGDYKDVTLVDDSRTRVTYEMVPFTYKSVRYFRLDFYVKAPDGTVSDVKIPYSHYINIDFGSEGIDLASSVSVNGTTYTNDAPVAHLKPSSPAVTFSHYLPEDLYNAGYRMAVVENGTTYYLDTGYGYQRYDYRGTTTGTAGQSRTLGVSFKLYHKDNKNSLTAAGSLSVTLKFDATPVTVFGVELQDGQYITSASKAVKTGTPTSSQRTGYVWNNGGVLVIKNFRPTYTLRDTSFIYKKNQGDLYIEVIGTNIVQIVSDSAAYGIYCNNDLTVTGSGTLTIAQVDSDGEYAANCRGIYLVGGSMTLEGATLKFFSGKGIEVAGVGQKITVKQLKALDDNEEIVITQPHLYINASKECFTVFDDTIFDIQGGTFDINATGYGAKVANVSAMQYKQTNYINGASTIIAGDAGGKWIYDTNTSYNSSSVHEIDAKVISSLRLVSGVDCIVVGSVVLESGDYLIKGADEVTKAKPESGGYAYNDGGTLVLHNFTYEGEGYITEMPSNPAGLTPSFTFRITLEGNNVIKNTGKTVGKPWFSWSGEYGIVAENDLVIDGYGTLTLNCDSGILYHKSMTVEDGDIIINAKSNGIYANGDEAENVTDTYLQDGFLTLDGGNVTIASSSTGINGYTTIRIPNGELVINSTSRTVCSFSGYKWLVTFDLDAATIMKIHAGSSEANAQSIPYSTDEELFNRFANVAYQYTRFVGDNGVLDVEVNGYKVCWEAWDVECDYGSADLYVDIAFYDEDGSMLMNESLRPETNYKIRVTVDYPYGTDEKNVYSQVNLKVNTAEGYKEYLIDAGKYDKSINTTRSDYYIIDPPVGNAVEGLEFDLSGYDIGKTAGDLKAVPIDDRNVYGDPSISIREDLGGIAGPDALDSNYVIRGGKAYWAVINVSLWHGYYVPEDTLASSFKLNGVFAALVETQWKYNSFIRTEQQIITLYFPLDAIKQPAATVSGTVTGVEEGERVKIELYSEGMPEPTDGLSIYGNDSFEFLDVDAGAYTVIATAEGYYEHTETITVTGTDVTLEIEMEGIPEEYTVSGTISGVKSGDSVTVQLFERGLAEPSYEVVVTGSQSFTIDRVFEGEYSVKAFGESYEDYNVSYYLVDGPSTLNISMEKEFTGYTVSGGVLGVDPGSAVYLYLKGTGSSTINYSKSIDAIDGFIFEDIPVGVYTLTAKANGYDDFVATVTVTDKNVEIYVVFEKPPAAYIYVGGVKLDSGKYLKSGANATTSTKPSDKYAYYKDGVLTLHNYEYTGKNGYFTDDDECMLIYTEGALTVVLEGTNKLDCNGNEGVYGIRAEDSSLTIKGSGTLNIKSYYACLSVSHNLTVTNANLTLESIYSIAIEAGNIVTVTDATVTGLSSRDGVWASDGVEIKDSTVNITAGSSGISSYGAVTVDNSQLTVKSCYSAISSNAFGTAVLLKNSTVILNSTEGTAINAPYGNIVIDGGTVTAKGYYTGMFSNEKVIINDGKVEAEGNNYGISGSKGVEINGGNITAKSTDTVFDPDYYAIRTDSTGIITIAPELTVQASTSPDGTLGEFDINNHREYDLVKIYVPTYYTVTFKSEGSADIQNSIEEGHPAEKPADPFKLGYRFLGWYDGSAIYDFTKPVTQNITLTAKFEKIDLGDVLLGDVDLNGKVNSADSNILKRIIGGIIFVENGSLTAIAADFNCDGKINSVDSNMLKRFIAGQQL